LPQCGDLGDDATMPDTLGNSARLVVAVLGTAMLGAWVYLMAAPWDVPPVEAERWREAQRPCGAVGAAPEDYRVLRTGDEPGAAHQVQQ
jgi:hypothetical protein